MHTRHFVLTHDGGIREFTPEQAAGVAAGIGSLPEYADRKLRYLQVNVDNESGTELRIQTAGASIQFDHNGKVSKAEPTTASEPISMFEHDAVVQWAIRDIPNAAPTFH